MLGFGLSIEPQLWALVFVMIRIGAAFSIAPVFGAVSIPLRTQFATWLGWLAPPDIPLVVVRSDRLARSPTHPPA